MQYLLIKLFVMCFINDLYDMKKNIKKLLLTNKKGNVNYSFSNFKMIITD